MAILCEARGDERAVASLRESLDAKEDGCGCRGRDLFDDLLRFWCFEEALVAFDERWIELASYSLCDSGPDDYGPGGELGSLALKSPRG